MPVTKSRHQVTIPEAEARKRDLPHEVLHEFAASRANAAFFAMQAEIAELLGGRDRFDPEILTPRLEAYVEEQVAAALRPCAPCRAPPAGVFFGNGARPC